MRLYKWITKYIFPTPKPKKNSAVSNRKIFIGREQELKILTECFIHTQNNRGQICIVYGDTGHGKTFLLDHFYQFIITKHKNSVVIRYECLENVSPYMSFEPLTKIISTLKNIAQIRNLDVPDISLEKDCQKENIKILYLKISLFLQKISSYYPITVFIDNAQWCDSSTKDFFSFLAQEINDFPIFFLISFRAITPPTINNNLPSKNITKISIDKFPVSFSQNYLHQKFYPHTFTYEFIQKFSETTQGIPLYWEQLSMLFLEENIFKQKKNLWVTDGNIQNISFPPSLKATIKERIRLVMRNENYKLYEFLQYASVLGGTFDRRLLTSLLSTADINELFNLVAESKLLTKINSDILHPFPSSVNLYKFCSDSFINIIYNENDNAKKIHLSILKKIPLFQELKYIFPYLIYHSESAEEYEILIKYCYICAKEEKKKLAYNNSIYFCKKALGCMDKIDAGTIRYKILLCLAAALVKIKEFKKAKSYLNKIIEKQEQSSKEFIKAMFLLIEIQKLWGKEAEATKSLEEIINNNSCTPEQKIMAINKIAQIYLKQKKWNEIALFLENGLELCTNLTDKRFYGAISYNLAKYNFKKGDWLKGLQIYQECLDIYSTEKNYVAKAQCTNHIAHIFHLQGNLIESVHYYKKTIDVLVQIDAQEQKVKVEIDLALALSSKKSYKESILLLKNSCLYYQCSANYLEVAKILSFMGRVYIAMEDFFSARQSLEKCISINHQENDFHSQAHCVESIGLFFLRKAMWDKAKPKFEKSIWAWKSLDLKEELATTMYYFAECYWKKRQTAASLKHFNESLNYCLDTNESHIKARILDKIAEICCFRGEWLNATDNLNESIKIRSQLGIILDKCNSYTIYGHLHLKQGHFIDAEAQYLNSYEIHIKLKDVDGQAEDVLNLGIMHLQAQRWEEAIEKFNISLALFREVQNKEKEAIVHQQIAKYYRRKELFDKAEDELYKALELKKKSLPWKKADIYYSLARNCFYAEDFKKSFAFFQQALDLYKEVQDSYMISRVLNNMGEVLIAQKKLLLAMEYFSESYILKERMEDVEGLAYTHMHIGRVYMRLNRIDKATDNFEISIVHWKTLGHYEYVAELSFQLGDLYEREGQIEQAKNNFKRAYHFFKNINREKLAIIDQKLEELE